MQRSVHGLYDIKDPIKYVKAAVKDAFSKVNLTTVEREELEGEGLLILCKLAKSYKPKMPGYKHGGSFAGYASRYLKLRLVRRWHSMTPEHILTVTPEGKREWQYLPHTLRLAIVHDQEYEHTTCDITDDVVTRIEEKIQLFDTKNVDQNIIVKYVVLLMAGHTPKTAQQKLNIDKNTLKTVHEIVSALYNPSVVNDN